MIDPLALLDLAPGQDEPWIVTAQGTCSRDEILGRAAAVADRLIARGAAGQAVIIALDSGPRFAVGLVAAWLADATPVLLDPQARGELDRAARMSGARIVLRGADDPAPLPDGLVALVPDDPPAAPRTAPRRADDAPILYLFTSGSTGTPTLAPKTLAMLAVEVDFAAGILDRPRHAATMVPWCHIFGFLFAFALPSRLHGRCDVSAGFSARALIERAAAGAVELVVAVPTIYRVMLRSLDADPLPPLPDRTRFVSSSAPLDDELRTRLTRHTGRPITELYGSTEAGGIACRHAAGPWSFEPHVAWRVDEDGVLFVRSPSVAFPSEADGFLRVGDRIRLVDGGFELCGRADDIVKIAGRRMALGEIRGELLTHPAVQEAEVLAVADGPELRLVAAVAVGASALTAEALKAHLRARLPDHKIPRRLLMLPELPLNAARKIDRATLRRLFEVPS